MRNTKDIPGCDSFALNEAPSPTPSSNKSPRSNTRSSQLTSQQETASSSSSSSSSTEQQQQQQQQPQQRSNMTWNYTTINIFISELMKAHYKNLMDTPSSTARTKKWEQLVDVFMELLRGNTATKHLAVDGILNSRKLKDKWTELKNNYFKTKESLAEPTNVVKNGNDLWPYYDMMETVLSSHPSKESDANTETAKSGSNSTPNEITTPPQQQQQQHRADTTADTTAPTTSTTNTIASAPAPAPAAHPTPNSSNSTSNIAGTGSVISSDHALSNNRKRRRGEILGESLEGQDRIMDCIERLNDGYIKSMSLISETIAKSYKEQGEIMMQHFRQNHELTINTFSNIIKQNDERWMSLFNNFFNNSNGSIKKIKSHKGNSGDSNSDSNSDNDNNHSSSS